MPVFAAGCWLVLAVVIAPRLLALATDDHALRLVGVVAIAVSPIIGFHIFHGLETMLAILIVTILTWSAIRSWLWIVAIVSVLAAATRPDLVAVVGPIWVVLGLTATDRRAVIRAGGAAAIALLLYLAGVWLYFGSPLPNTAAVKVAGGLAGATYVTGFLVMVAPAVGVGVLGLVLRRAAVLKDRIVLLTVLPAIALVATYVVVDPITGFAYRFLVPVLPLVVVATVRIMTLTGLPQAAPVGRCHPGLHAAAPGARGRTDL